MTKEKISRVELDGCTFGGGGKGVHSTAPVEIYAKDTEFATTKTAIDLSHDTQKPTNTPSGTGNNWYKTPVGIVFLAVFGMVVFAIITVIVKHYFPNIGL